METRACCRVSRWILLLAVVSCVVCEVAASNITVDVTLGLITPQALAINQGDTVTWVMGQGADLDVRSYTGEWQSPFLGQGGTFSHVFNTPGDYVYGSHVLFG